MTLGQLNLYSASIITRKKQNQLNSMSLFRVAYHADQDEYARIVRDIERDL